REACESSRRATSSLGLDDMLLGNRRGPLPLRWAYLYMLRELAQHCGHADILREQLTSEPPLLQIGGQLRTTPSAVNSTRTRVVTARRPWRMTTGSGKFRSGGTMVFLVSDGPGLLTARYTRSQRAAMSSPRTATAPRVQTVAHASLFSLSRR